MVEVIGLDEKDIDKAMLGINGLPVRAPRDMKAGESFWVFMGPAVSKPCSECQKRRRAEERMAEMTKGMIVYRGVGYAKD